jgi:PTH1 family peptidyl-tRNA hydrolase
MVPFSDWVHALHSQHEIPLAAFDRLENEIVEIAKENLMTINKIESTFARPIDNPTHDATDMMGLDIMVDYKDGQLVPVIIEHNDMDSGGQQPFDTFHSPAGRLGAHSRSWIANMGYRGLVEHALTPSTQVKSFTPATPSKIKMIVGLGNHLADADGRRYENTRHNLGSDFVSGFVNSIWEEFTDETGEVVAMIARSGTQVYFKALTWYNDLGPVVRKYSRLHGILPSEILIIHDALDLPLGQVKLRASGPHQGNKGLESIMTAFGGVDEFPRISIGLAVDGPKDRDVNAYFTNTLDQADVDGFKPILDEATLLTQQATNRGVEETIEANSPKGIRRQAKK